MCVCVFVHDLCVGCVSVIVQDSIVFCSIQASEYIADLWRSADPEAKKNLQQFENVSLILAAALWGQSVKCDVSIYSVLFYSILFHSILFLFYSIPILFYSLFVSCIDPQ